MISILGIIVGIWLGTAVPVGLFIARLLKKEGL